jgi:hypothetical protein
VTAAALRTTTVAAPTDFCSQQTDVAGGWAAALLDPAQPCPPGLKVWNASDPTLRLAVYRNNVLASLVDGLAASFAVVQALVGDAFFRAMAAVFVRAAPPRSPVLAEYGDGFADFIARFEPASGLPYLPDIARLEFACIQAFHAADAPVLTAADAASVLGHAERTGEMRLVCHPAVRLVRSAHPVVALWAAHQDDTAIALGDIDLDQAESALVLRPALTVHVIGLTPGAAAFACALWCQADLASAAAEGAQADPGFDLSTSLRLLLLHGALTAVRHPKDRLEG